MDLLMLNVLAGVLIADCGRAESLLFCNGRCAVVRHLLGASASLSPVRVTLQKSNHRMPILGVYMMDVFTGMLTAGREVAEPFLCYTGSCVAVRHLLGASASRTQIPDTVYRLEHRISMNVWSTLNVLADVTRSANVCRLS